MFPCGCIALQKLIIPARGDCAVHQHRRMVGYAYSDALASHLKSTLPVLAYGRQGDYLPLLEAHSR
jgi:hypothetical protein